jgi:hypothetical protein
VLKLLQPVWLGNETAVIGDRILGRPGIPGSEKQLHRRPSLVDDPRELKAVRAAWHPDVGEQDGLRYRTALARPAAHLARSANSVSSVTIAASIFSDCSWGSACRVGER